MAKFELFGSYVALVTPFTDSDEVDYACIEELVEWHVKEGTAGRPTVNHAVLFAFPATSERRVQALCPAALPANLPP